jgi:hypothetical protein
MKILKSLHENEKKMMKVDFQTWITFEILWGNGIFAPLRIMDTPLEDL